MEDMLVSFTQDVTCNTFETRMKMSQGRVKIISGKNQYYMMQDTLNESLAWPICHRFERQRV